MIKNGRVAVGDTEMYYAAFGKGGRKLVVFPGLSDGLATVKGKAFLLSVPYRKYLKDWTVYLFSRKNDMPEGYTIRDMAEDQVRAMESLGIGRACVAGVSQGGMIAQHMAAAHPEAVEKLVLAVTAPYPNETVKGAVSSWISMAKEGAHASLMADTAEKTYSKVYLEKNRKLLRLAARFTKPKDYGRFLRNAYAILGFDARDELAKITAPTLIIAGDDDNTVGNEAPYELRDGIAGSELHVYHGLGHGLFEEAKDFYDRIFAFCEK